MLQNPKPIYLTDVQAAEAIKPLFPAIDAAIQTKKRRDAA
jgi:hypothetical protein